MPRILVALLLLVLAAGPTALAAERSSLRFTIWSGNQAHLDLLNGIAAAYRSAHPATEVRFEVIPFGDYVQKITLQIAAGTAPDLGWLLETSAPTFINAGVLADVAPLLTGDQAYAFRDFSQPALRLWVRNNAVYGIPFSTSPFITFFNRDLFKAARLTPPDLMAARGAWTWDALRRSAYAITRTGGAGIYGFESVDGQGYDVRVWHTLVPIIRAYGGDAWEGEQCGLASPRAVQAVQLYHEMIFKERSVVPPGETGDFFSGRSAITVTQLSRVSKLEGAKFAWGVAPLPAGPAGGVAVIGQAAVVVFAKSANRSAAADFLKFMTTTENTARMARFFPPARDSILKSREFLTANPLVSPDQMQIVADGIRTGTVLPSHANFPRIEAAARPVFDRLWRTDADVRAVLSDVCAVIQPLLKE
jgi:multiple sugar transport system substrate-binding protein